MTLRIIRKWDDWPDPCVLGLVEVPDSHPVTSEKHRIETTEAIEKHWEDFQNTAPACDLDFIPFLIKRHPDWKAVHDKCVDVIVN